MPDRQESASFLDMASAHGLTYCLLRHIQKPDLLTPVSIFQFIFGPVLSPEVLQLVDPPPACPPVVASKDPKPISESTHSSPTQRLVKQANSSVTAGEPVQFHSAAAAAGPPAAAISCPAKIAEGEAGVPVTLLVLDFDWSMIEENTDTFVVRELNTWEAFQRYVLLLSASPLTVSFPPSCNGNARVLCAHTNANCYNPHLRTPFACSLYVCVFYMMYCIHMPCVHADRVGCINQQLDQL